MEHFDIERCSHHFPLGLQQHSLSWLYHIDLGSTSVGSGSVSETQKDSLSVSHSVPCLVSWLDF